LTRNSIFINRLQKKTNKMKKKLILLVALLTASIEVLPQIPGTSSVSEGRTSAPYHFIHISGNLFVDLVQAPDPGVTVTATPFNVANTITLLKNDTLFVYQLNTDSRSRYTRVQIAIDNLVALEVSGHTRVNGKGLVNADYLTLKATDGAVIRLDVRALKIQSRATGCSYIGLSGTVACSVEMQEDCSHIDSRQLDVMDVMHHAGVTL
jgi:hypothetical protein